MAKRVEESTIVKEPGFTINWGELQKLSSIQQAERISRFMGQFVKEMTDCVIAHVDSHENIGWSTPNVLVRQNDGSAIRLKGVGFFDPEGDKSTFDRVGILYFNGKLSQWEPLVVMDTKANNQGLRPTEDLLKQSIDMIHVLDTQLKIHEQKQGLKSLIGERGYRRPQYKLKDFEH